MKKTILVASVLVVFSLFLPGANAQVTSNVTDAELQAQINQLLQEFSRLQIQVNALRSMPVPPAPQQATPVPYPVPLMLMPYPAPQTPSPVPYTVPYTMVEPEPNSAPVPPRSFPEPTLIQPSIPMPIPPGYGQDNPPWKPDQSWCYTFGVPMGVGASGEQVRALRIVLEKEGFPTSGENEYYDEELAAAVSGFQEKWASEVLEPLKLKRSTGYAGKMTLKKLVELYGCGAKPVLKSEPPKPSGKITVTSPNGGESWNANAKNLVTWKIEPSIQGNVNFYFLEEFADGVWKPMLRLGSAPATQGEWAFPNYPLGGTRKYKLRASTDPAEFGVCTWKNVEHPLAKSCLEGASAPRVFDDSDAPFLYTSPDSSSRPPSFILDLVNPRSADGVPRTEEKWQAGSVKQIEWTYFGSRLPKNISIYLLPSEAFWRNAQEAPYAQVAGPLSNQERWTNIVVPNPGAVFGKDVSSSNTYVLLLCEGGGPRIPECNVGDTSVGIYISSSPVVTKPIPAPAPQASNIKILAPAGGDEWVIGSTRKIQWRYNDSFLAKLKAGSFDSISIDIWEVGGPHGGDITRMNATRNIRGGDTYEGIDVTGLLNFTSFVWQVGSVGVPSGGFGQTVAPEETFRIVPGKYQIRVCGGTSSYNSLNPSFYSLCDKSTAFSIVKEIAKPPVPAAGPKILKFTPSSGPVGTQVTITGTGFGGPNKITFGDGAVVLADTDIHYSKDGKTITFVVPLTLAPWCVFDPRPCEIVPRPVTPGTHQVVVTSGETKSNPVAFKVTEGRDPSAEYPAVKVIEPTQGETLVIGEPAVTLWNSFWKTMRFDLYLVLAGSISGADSTNILAQGLSGDSRGYKFIVPKVPTGKYELIVRQYSDISVGHTPSYVEGRSGVFTVSTTRPLPPSPTLVTLAEVTYPKGGEKFTPESRVNIQWELTAAAAKRPLRGVGLYLTKPGSYPYPYEKPTPIVEYFPSSSAGSFPWTVPATPGEYLITLQPITVDGQGGEMATPSGKFTIRAADTELPNAQSLQLLTPNGGEVWRLGQDSLITWRTSPGFTANRVYLYLQELSTNAGSADAVSSEGVWRTIRAIGSAPADSGRFYFPRYSFGAERQFKVRISNSPSEIENICMEWGVPDPNVPCPRPSGFNHIYDDSNAPFTYSASTEFVSLQLDLVAPLVAKRWDVGSTQTIAWTYAGTYRPENVRIYLAPLERTLAAQLIAGPFRNGERWTAYTVGNPSTTFGARMSQTNQYKLTFCAGEYPNNCAASVVGPTVTIAPLAY